jgi:hypothetical protein
MVSIETFIYFDKGKDACLNRYEFKAAIAELDSGY